MLLSPELFFDGVRTCKTKGGKHTCRELRHVSNMEALCEFGEHVPKMVPMLDGLRPVFDLEFNVEMLKGKN